MEPHDGPAAMPRDIPLGIAGVPASEEERRYVRQATMMLRYRLWLNLPVEVSADP